MTTVLSIPNALMYAQMQMAAEALVRDDNGVLHALGDDLANALKQGNGRASRFPSEQAAAFARHWKVLDQCMSSGTGFSGTLFECILADPSTGARVGEKVISFRSTEFIDDAARDNQATNQMEIAQFGFAFGQLRDMEKWFAKLGADGRLGANETYSVTGYSLEGQL